MHVNYRPFHRNKRQSRFSYLNITKNFHQKGMGEGMVYNQHITGTISMLLAQSLCYWHRQYVTGTISMLLAQSASARYS